MNFKYYTLFLSIFIVLALTSCIASAPDPMLVVGHGAFIAPNGEEFEPDAAFIQRAQRVYITAFERYVQTNQKEHALSREEIAKTEDIIRSAVDDQIFANALMIDWLVEKVEPSNMAHVLMANNALRWHYYLSILGERRPEEIWTKGIAPDIAERLEANGIPTVVFLKTDLGGEAYIQQCREAGVPVPEAMFSNEWDFMGIFDQEFISESSQAELWLHTSESPAGACLALPRYPGNSSCGDDNNACLLGIICLGTDTSNSCFFDNPRGRSFERDVEVSINEFVGGADLNANGQGVCSDCHAGENPFVIHPEKPPFAALPSLLPLAWPDPLVHPTWPQNPGPTNLLAAVASNQNCTSCHRTGSAGRFPEVSNQLPGYCGTVLATAMGTSSKSTMPPFGMDRNLFTAHINALAAACNAPPPDEGEVVEVDDIPDDDSVISPPQVIAPLYQCATQVAVRGSILDAKVSLFINGTFIDSLIARNPTEEVFNVPDLVAGDVVTAEQEVDGVPSGPSDPVTVGDHTLDFPGGLPAPEIDPTLIYQCADQIAVRHVPGANITVFSNGGDPRSRSTSTEWSAISPAKRPFDIGDEFTAEAELCGDVSPLSAPQSAVAEPSTIPAPTLNPPTVFDGQQLVTVENLVNGSHGVLDEASFGTIQKFSTPVSWYPDLDVATNLGRPLVTGDQLLVSQSLCSQGPIGEVPPVEDCESLPAPKIRTPLEGDTFVVVTESIPGARIRIYDNSGNELGDGSGTVITLKRALTGSDVVTVVQQVGECKGRTGFRIRVHPRRGGDDQ